LILIHGVCTTRFGIRSVDIDEEVSVTLGEVSDTLGEMQGFGVLRFIALLSTPITQVALIILS
jgi:hypothetical protein